MIEDIKRQVNIVELAKEFGLEPNQQGFIYSIYKNEKNRSLKLYEDQNSFWCYATGKGGDVINFYADYHKINNKEAIIKLGERLGINGKEAKGIEQCKEREDEHSVFAHRATQDGMEKRNGVMPEDKKREIYQSFERYCNGLNDAAYQYLTGPKRGLNDKSTKKFRLFFVKDCKKTIDHLMSLYQLDELKSVGLFNENGRFVFGNHPLIIPYIENDEIIYLRGRKMPPYDEEGTGKYIGLAGQTAKRFFNIDALKKISDEGEILIAEGEFDTMRADQEGITVIGIPGVNNIPGNAKDILGKREIHICFDNDEPGIKGMQDAAFIIGKAINGLYLQKHSDITDYLNDPANEGFSNSEFVKYKKLVPEKKSKIKLVTAREIQQMELPPMIWIVEGLIPEGLNILAGKPKSGKSFMALNFALSITRGAKALGQFKTKKSSVLYLALEDNFRRIQDRMNNIFQAEQDKTAPENLYFLKENIDLPKLNDGGIDELKKIVEDNPEIRLIIVDTFGRSIADKGRKDNNSYRADYSITSPLQEFGIKNHISIFLVHHTKKSEAEDVFDDISGTNGIAGAMDGQLIIKRNGNKAKLFSRPRDTGEKEFSIIFDERCCCWNVVKEESNLTAERQEIFDTLKDFNRQMRTSEIASILGKELSNVSKMLNKMVKDGKIISPKFGYFALPNEEDEEKPKQLKLLKSNQSSQSVEM